jgi:hypothetical protein
VSVIYFKISGFDILKNKIIDRVSIDRKHNLPQTHATAASIPGAQLHKKRLTFDNIYLSRLPQAKKWQGLACLAIQLEPISKN